MSLLIKASKRLPFLQCLLLDSESVITVYYSELEAYAFVFFLSLKESDASTGVSGWGERCRLYEGMCVLEVQEHIALGELHRIFDSQKI